MIEDSEQRPQRPDQLSFSKLLKDPQGAATLQTSRLGPPSSAFFIDYNDGCANLRGLHDCLRLAFILARLLSNGLFRQQQSHANLVCGVAIPIGSKFFAQMGEL